MTRKILMPRNDNNKDVRTLALGLSRELYRRLRQEYFAIADDVARLPVKYTANLEDLTSLVTGYTFKTQKERVADFREWVDKRLKRKLEIGKLEKLDTFITEEVWYLNYLKEAYSLGAIDINASVYSALTSDKALASGFSVKDAGSRFLVNKSNVISNRIHLSKLEVVFTRNLGKLKGITAQMSDEMTEILADGLINGTSPRDVARELRKIFRRQGGAKYKARSELIARTEMIFAKQTAKLQEIKALNSDTLTVYARYRANPTARPHHLARNNLVMEFELIQGLFGEPNCQCWSESVIEGIDTKGSITPLKNPKKDFFRARKGDK